MIESTIEEMGVEQGIKHLKEYLAQIEKEPLTGWLCRTYLNEEEDYVLYYWKHNEVYKA